MQIRTNCLLFLIGGMSVLCGSCKDENPYKVFVLPSSPPVTWQNETIPVPDNIRTEIAIFQYLDGHIYYRSHLPSEIKIYDIDLDKKQIDTFFYLSDADMPFEIDPNEFSFYIRKEDKLQKGEVKIIERRRIIHTFQDINYQFTTSIPETDAGCFVNNLFADCAFPEINNFVYLPSVCSFNQLDERLYPESRVLIQIALDDSQATGSFVLHAPYPNEYHNKIMATNCLVTNNFRLAGDQIWANFSGAQNLYRYDPRTHAYVDNIPLASSMFGPPMSLPKGKFNNPIEELIHFMVQGYFPNLLVAEDQNVLIRLAICLDPAFSEQSFTRQKDRMGAIFAYQRKSMIFYDLKSNRRLGEYVIEDEGLALKNAFIHNGHLYLVDQTIDNFADDQIAFKKINIDEVVDSFKME